MGKKQIKSPKLKKLSENDVLHRRTSKRPSQKSRVGKVQPRTGTRKRT